ncbi:MAG: type II toxin-antitoxin system HicA family toxin [Acidimicrobiales bacterium]
MRVRDIIRIIEEDGWVHVRTTGSHRQFHHPVKPGTVTVSGKPSKEIPIVIEISIFRQAGIARRR